MKRKLKKSVVIFLYSLVLFLMMGGLFFLEKKQSSENFNQNEENFQYVSKSIIDEINDMPVNGSEKIINRPYKDENVKLIRDYYNFSDDEQTQQNSIIYYDGTYMQSSGVSYGLDNQFEVISILDGVITDIIEDNFLGNTLIIEHDNGITSIYQSIDDINVVKGQNIKQGDVVAKSSTSNISADLGNHLYFELIINGINVDPEEYYGKPTDEI